MLHKRQGYWETRHAPTWSRGWIFDSDNNRRVVRSQGVLGVLYDPEVCDGTPGIIVALGHDLSGLNLELAVGEAMELIEMLAAAIGEANGVVQPFIDVTDTKCKWLCCKAVQR
ncbi:hypothetical protein NN3_64020 [Nocardia neocaledoniensis NBRC 108232]|uniref:Uncharacterized protein n=1 Tax=Nocardia neocaledoniensis TaxID=236511 RepID=A0A317NSG9_9NOCA|nr:hypothetical protein [Nocardia neocaledoniensis]PWV77833.1 hypothetical protein DFR69_103433 [Nocardia neocaledoniensis]GEM35395.1 hypothetical protein NN3_64020 [Nocardia neocaledoniensis NBRC 108232]